MIHLKYLTDDGTGIYLEPTHIPVAEDPEISLFGYYSKIQEGLLRKHSHTGTPDLRDPTSWIYLDESGNQVKVTEVSTNQNFPHSQWTDIQHMGKLVKFIGYRFD